MMKRTLFVVIVLVVFTLPALAQAQTPTPYIIWPTPTFFPADSGTPFPIDLAEVFTNRAQAESVVQGYNTFTRNEVMDNFLNLVLLLSIVFAIATIVLHIKRLNSSEE